MVRLGCGATCLLGGVSSGSSRLFVFLWQPRWQGAIFEGGSGKLAATKQSQSLVSYILLGAIL
jgi:hypothetical protein